MAVTRAEIIQHMEPLAGEHPKENLTLPIIFTPEERGSQLLNEKILSSYSLTNKSIKERHTIRLIIGTPLETDADKKNEHHVRIHNVPINQIQRYSLRSGQFGDMTQPGIYAEWQGKKYSISRVIERALELKYHVFLVGSKDVRQFRPNGEYKHVMPVHQAKPIPLVTPNGKNLRELPVDDFMKKTQHLTAKQFTRLQLAYEEKTAPQIAQLEGNVTPQTIRYSIQESLRHKSLNMR